MNQFTERHYQALLRYLKEGVRSGTLQDGSKLPPERELAELLSFSVPSVREAMHFLKILGLLTQDPDDSFRLRNDLSRSITDIFTLILLMDQHDYADVLRLRRSIELQSIPAICANINETEKQTLYLCLMRMIAAPYGDSKADAEFHDVFVSASRDKLASILNRTLVQLMNPQGSAPSTSYYFGDRDEFVQVHMQLYQAIAANQCEAASDAVNAHYDLLERLFGYHA